MYQKFLVIGSTEKKYKGNFNARFRRMKEIIVKKTGLITATEPRKPPVSNFRIFSITAQSGTSPMESPQSPISAQKRRALEVAAKLSASPTTVNNSRDLYRNPFDSTAGAAASPTRQSRRSSALANVQPPHEAWN
jgi:hypothetical protein